MLFSESFFMALTSLAANKMRSLLTMLGIIIGVSAVIAMLAIGAGFKEKMLSSFNNLGTNMLTVSPGAANRGGPRGAAGSMRTLKLADAEAIEKKIKNINYVSAVVSGSYQLVNGHENWNTSVSGVEPEFMIINSLKVTSGTFISRHDLDKRERVVVIGTTVATNLFGQTNPVGKNIRIKNQPFRIIGVLASKGSGGFGRDQDDVAYIPITTAQERMSGVDYVNYINVDVESVEKMNRVQGEIETLLRQRHRITGDKEDDFHVDNMTSFIETMETQMTSITIFLSCVAAISLVVGGIGIMNIMMVSVTERTREIGIRKALGATFFNVMTQFLIESMVIGVVGGLIGIAMGCSIAIVVSNVFDMPTAITPLPIVISFSFSLVIGLFFGIYPARKAAKLDPIEALRYE